MTEVRLEPWTADDRELLERSNTPEMTRFLGGPESAAKLALRHLRYLDNTFTGQMLVIVRPDGTRAGSIGFWEHGDVWETGWSVVPDHQGRGIASAALTALVPVVAAHGGHPSLHAYPRVDNVASNALCRRAGWTLAGEIAFEYPKGNPITCHDWSVITNR